MTSPCASGAVALRTIRAGAASSSSIVPVPPRRPSALPRQAGRRRAPTAPPVKVSSRLGHPVLDGLDRDRLRDRAAVQDRQCCRPPPCSHRGSRCRPRPARCRPPSSSPAPRRYPRSELKRHGEDDFPALLWPVASVDRDRHRPPRRADAGPEGDQPLSPSWLNGHDLDLVGGAGRKAGDGGRGGGVELGHERVPGAGGFPASRYRSL